jgi:hypothetical protein
MSSFKGVDPSIVIALGFSSVTSVECSEHIRSAIKVPYHVPWFSGLFFKFWIRGAAARAGVDRWITTHCIFMALSGYSDLFGEKYYARVRVSA